MTDGISKSIQINTADAPWEGADNNIKWTDGREYGRFRRLLRKDPHGLTVMVRIVAPPGKAWKIVGRASELGEDVYIVKGAYYDTAGKIVARDGAYMFNAPGALHGGISIDLTMYIHWCSGKGDEMVSQKLIDFEPKEFV
jgi:hypothetical protein